MAVANLLGEWARLLVASLVQAGVRNAVVSPGSRSTAFAWALSHQSGISCRWLWDERSAAFFALGQARVTGRPTLLLCTSGSAAANYFPAVVEASLGRIPLILLTADRPFELQGVAAAQCMDQVKLYGDFCRGYFDLGLPEAELPALLGVQRIANQAVHHARYPDPGPVQINARARKPLEPATTLGDAERSFLQTVQAVLDRGVGATEIPQTLPNPRTLEHLTAACEAAERGLLVCGPCPEVEDPKALFELAERSGFALCCEATSQLRWSSARGTARPPCDGFDWLFRCAEFRKRAEPDLILVFGAPPTSTGFEQYLAAYPGVARYVVAQYGFPDPQNSARELCLGVSPDRVARALSEALRQRPKPRKPATERWLELFATGNELTWSLVNQELSKPEAACGEGRVVRDIVQALPRGSLLLLGNSLPVRDVDAYVRALPLDITVLCQRGVNGIDGLISQGLGACSAQSQRTVLLIGDISFLHDVGGLAAGRDLKVPCVVVVIDNNGGRIFEQLPIGQVLLEDPESADYWLTPHGLDLRNAAELFGLTYYSAEDSEGATLALRDALEHPGCSVLHVRVAPSSASQAQRRILNGLEARLPALLSTPSSKP